MVRLLRKNKSSFSELQRGKEKFKLVFLSHFKVPKLRPKCLTGAQSTISLYLIIQVISHCQKIKQDKYSTIKNIERGHIHIIFVSCIVTPFLVYY
jgi:hypothetical protein